MALLAIIFCGLAIAQLVAMLHVWVSNQSLHSLLAAIKAAGYFPIPGDLVSPSLTSIEASILGGLFFTLTLGAGVTLICVAATYISLSGAKINLRKFVHSKNYDQARYKMWFDFALNVNFWVIISIVFWILLLIKLNIDGICLIESLYLIAIPIVVAPLTYLWVKLSKFKQRRNQILILIAWIAPVIVLTLIWTTQWDKNIFIRIRDHLLLENRVGRAINDFYYRYTLYPAEAFKPLSQKMLKTCFLTGIGDSKKALTLERILRRQDYLAVSTPDSADIIVGGNGPNLLINIRNRPPLEVPFNEFMSNSSSILEKLSLQKDSKKFFRSLIFYSLISGFPVVLYALLYGLLYGCLKVIIRPVNAAAATSCLCFLAGLALFWPVWQSEVSPDDIVDLSAALSSNHWKVRLSGLQEICAQKKDISDFSQYKKSKESPHISERYWLARALAVSTGPGTYEDLLLLSRDSHPNVQCQAFYGLGRRKQHNAISYIYSAIKASDHWYVQWYGYRALRSLGWMQPQSKQKLF